MCDALHKILIFNIKRWNIPIFVMIRYILMFMITTMVCHIIVYNCAWCKTAHINISLPNTLKCVWHQSNQFNQPLTKCPKYDAMNNICKSFHFHNTNDNNFGQLAIKTQKMLQLCLSHRMRIYLYTTELRYEMPGEIHLQKEL